MNQYVCVHPTCDIGFKCKFQDVASVVACSCPISVFRQKEGASMNQYVCVQPTCDIGFKCKFQDVANVVACSEWHLS